MVSVAILKRLIDVLERVERHLVTSPCDVGDVFGDVGDVTVTPPVTSGAARTRKWREKKRSAERHSVTSQASPRDATYTTLTSSFLPSLEKEERLEIVAIGPAPKYSAAFEEFYRQYPRHEGKREARKVWLKVTKSEVTNDELITGAMRYATDPNRDPAFTKHCATWLNKGCWTDGPLPPRSNGHAKDRSVAAACDDLIARAEERERQVDPGGSDFGCSIIKGSKAANR